MNLLPSVADERAAALRHQLGKKASPAIRQRLTTGWRSHAFLPALAFFVLTTGALAGLFGFFWMVIAAGQLTRGHQVAALLTGIVALCTAEFLIAQKWFGTGVETALWLWGPFALILSLPGDGAAEALLLFAAAAAVATFRVRSPLTGAVACGLVMAYFVSTDNDLVAAALGVALTLLALLALRAEQHRPSTEWLWIVLVIAAPVATFISLSAVDQATLGAVIASAGVDELVFATFLPLAVLLLVAAVRMRHHAPLLASLLCTAFAGIAAHRMLPFTPELSMAVGGALLLGTSMLVARYLRDRTTGIVATEASLTGHDDLLMNVATVTSAPQLDVPEARAQGGGGFGGAGATGDY